MADREKSTRPTARVLRESFIAYFQRDGQEASLRLLDELAYHFSCEERGSYLMGKADGAIERSEVLGAARDLRQAAEQLRESAHALTENASEERELLRITLAIADADAEVQPIADRLDVALARFLDAPAG
jgi:tRNA U34 5-methylaminomethyl-2-thiouridine-forming methyltransferase MnmC